MGDRISSGAGQVFGRHRTDNGFVANGVKQIRYAAEFGTYPARVSIFSSHTKPIPIGFMGR